MMALKGFRRVTLLPGERRQVAITLKESDLERWHTDQHCFVMEAGSIELMAGSSSADIRLQKIIRVTK